MAVLMSPEWPYCSPILARVGWLVGIRCTELRGMSSVVAK